MLERFDRGLQPDFGEEPTPEGTAEKEYQVEMSDNDWATINYLALHKIEQRAEFLKKHEDGLKGQEELARERGIGDKLAETYARDRARSRQEQEELVALDDMLTRWQEAGVPVIAKQDKADGGVRL